MIKESLEFKNNSLWFTTLVSKKENLPFIYKALEEIKAVEIKIIDKNAPEEFTITAENTEEGLKIIGTATDTESGIEKYEYYVKKIYKFVILYSLFS